MAFPSPMTSSQISGNVPSPSSDVLSNLRHVFLSTFDPKNLVTNLGADSTDALQTAKKSLLAKLPRMISCCVTLWRASESARLFKAYVTFVSPLVPYSS